MDSATSVCNREISQRVASRFPLPFPVPPFDVKIYAHQRSGKREATRWLISLLQTLVAESTAS